MDLLAHGSVTEQEWLGRTGLGRTGLGRTGLGALPPSFLFFPVKISSNTFVRLEVGLYADQ
jgi:hypothetical protein